MNIEVPYAYTPSLKFEAQKALPSGTNVLLGGKVTVRLDVASAADLSEGASLRFGSEKSTWMKLRDHWVRPLSMSRYAEGKDPTNGDLISPSKLAALAAAGHVPVVDSFTGHLTMKLTDTLGRIASGEAAARLLEQIRPKNPSSAVHTNYIDSGDYRQAAAQASMQWDRLRLFVCDGVVYHRTREPKLAQIIGSRLMLVPADASAAKAYALADWAEAMSHVADPEAYELLLDGHKAEPTALRM